VLIVIEFVDKPSQRMAVKLGFVHTGQSRTPEGPVMVFRRQESTIAT
jgi:hypothetical protein